MSAYSDLVLADGPIAYWTASDATGSQTLLDLGPNGLTAAIRGDVAFNAPSLLSGSNGTAVDIVAGGSGSGFDVPPTAPFNFTGDFTADFWIQTIITTPQVIFKFGGNNYYGVQGSPSIFGTLRGPSVADGTPHHVAFVTQSGLVTVYVDGVAAGETAGRIGPFGDGYVPHIGYYYDFNPGLGLTGRLQHIAFYDKALSAGKIAARAAFRASTGPGPFLFDRNLSNVTWTSGNSCTITAAEPTGGSGDYSIAWHLPADPSAGPSGASLVAGQAARTATLTNLPVGSNRFAIAVASDGQTSIASYRRLVRATGLAPLRIGAIGDSTEVFHDSSATMARYLSTVQGDRPVTPINRAVSGSKTTEWGAGSANWLAARAAFYPAPDTPPLDWISIGLGMNDWQAGVSATAFRTAYLAVIAVASARGEKLLLNYPIWREPGPFAEVPSMTFDDAGIGLMLQYQAVIDDLIDGVTTFAGDRTSYYVFAARPTLYLNRTDGLPGGIHPNELGAEVMGLAKGAALAKALAGGGSAPGDDSIDPGEANVRDGWPYRIDGVDKVGTLQVGSPGPADPDEVVAAVLAAEVEPGVSLLQANRLMLAAAAGNLSGAGTGQVTIRGGGSEVVRITAATDDQGNRTVTLSPGD